MKFENANHSSIYETFVSTYDMILEKGRKIGLEQGVILGEKRIHQVVVRNLLMTNKFSIVEIANFANVTEAFVLRVKEML